MIETPAIRTLFPRERETSVPLLSESLYSHYDGDLRFPEPTEKPYVIANFVSTLDGVVSFSIPGFEGGGAISGDNDGDKFIMGLLRASVDAILVASRTFRAAGRRHLWLPESVYPAKQDEFRAYRSAALRKSANPLLVIVSGTGAIDLGYKVFHTSGSRVVIIATEQARSRLEREGVSSLPATEVRVRAETGGRIAPSSIVTLLKQDFGVGLLLTEGGPTLLGELLAHRLVDELFLTMAPQIAGRMRQRPRPALVEGVEFTPETAPWMELLSAKRAGDHLYLRYRTKIEVR